MHALLNKVLESYNIRGTVVGITEGPTITRYEVQLIPGERINSLLRISKEIALALKTDEPRFSLLPEKGVVGIEVPKKERKLITFETLPKVLSLLEIPIGVTMDGEPTAIDLAKTPNLLIAGTTNSGKSNLLNLLIYTILTNWDSKEVQMYLIDTKRVEFSLYKGHPSVLDVGVEPVIARMILEKVCEEMQTRFELFQKERVRDISEYKAKAKRIPRLLVIVDELADLVLFRDKNIFEQLLCKIAQKGRAVGVHLIAATQRPSVDIIDGLIKANFPSRIAFKVATEIDSRIILDMGGAEKLLGAGDMLYKPSYDNPTAMPKRIQCAYLPLEAIKKVIPELKEVEQETVEEESKVYDLTYRQILHFISQKKVFSLNDLCKAFDRMPTHLLKYISQLEAEGKIVKCNIEQDFRIIEEALGLKGKTALLPSEREKVMSNGFWKII